MNAFCKKTFAYVQAKTETEFLRSRVNVIILATSQVWKKAKWELGNTTSKLNNTEKHSPTQTKPQSWHMYMHISTELDLIFYVEILWAPGASPLLTT